jgi:hypothetical protein
VDLRLVHRPVESNKLLHSALSGVCPLPLAEHLRHLLPWHRREPPPLFRQPFCSTLTGRLSVPTNLRLSVARSEGQGRPEGPPRSGLALPGVSTALPFSCRDRARFHRLRHVWRRRATYPQRAVIARLSVGLGCQTRNLTRETTMTDDKRSRFRRCLRRPRTRIS